MVLNCEAVLETIENTHWFVNLGQPNSLYARATSLKQAVELWKSKEFEEAHSVAWEALRSNIPRQSKQEWVRCFSECKDSLARNISKSSEAQKLLSHCQQGVEDFILLLPHVGAIGESLTEKAELIFFTNQLKIYEAGHWVCGWQGELHEDKFVYPKSNFIIF